MREIEEKEMLLFFKKTIISSS